MFRDQILAQLDLVEAETPSPMVSVFDQVELVRGLVNNPPSGLFWDCWDYGAADAGVMFRTSYQMTCLDWEAQLTSALARLGDLVASYAPARAEVFGALSDQATTPSEQATVTIGTKEDWWSNSPDFIKYGALALGALLLLRAFK